MKEIQKYGWYLTENEGWQNVLKQHEFEIPHLEDLLTKIIEDQDIARVEKDAIQSHFGNQLELKLNEITILNKQLNDQQNRLKNDCEINFEHDIDAICTQDILREKIKNIENTYVELKSSFMNYLSSIN